MLWTEEEANQNIVKYMPLAKSIAMVFARRCPGLIDEFFSDAFLALVEGTRRYDTEKDVKFSTFMIRRLNGAMKDVMRRNRPYGYHFNSDVAPFIFSFSEQKLDHHAVKFIGSDDLYESPNTDYDEHDAFFSHFHILSSREKEVLRLHFICGVRQEDIGPQFGLTKSGVNRLIKTALVQLKTNRI